RMARGGGPRRGLRARCGPAGQAAMIAAVKGGARRGVRGALAPVVGLLARLGVSPDAVTWSGLVVTVAGAILLALGHFRWGALVALAGGLLDSLDGALARAKHGGRRWGAFPA